MGRRAGLKGNNYTVSEAYMAGGKKGLSVIDMF
jgi:hypothetical protein